MRRMTPLLILAAALATGGLARGATLMLDDFESPKPAEFYLIGFSHENGKPFQHGGLSGTIGSQRDAVVDIQGTPTANSAQVLIGYDESLFQRGVMQVTTAAGPASIVTLQYDGVDENTDALSNAHGLSTFVMSEGGVTIDFLSVDAPGGPGMEVTIRLTSDGATSSYTGLVSETASPVTFVVPFSEFTADGGFSYDHIDSLEFVFNGSALSDVDFRIDQITTVVPEPSSVVLALLGVALVGAVRRRTTR